MIIKIKATCLTISKDISRVNKDKAIYEGQRCNLFIDGKYFPSNITIITNSMFVEFDASSELDIEIIYDNIDDVDKIFILDKKFELREANNLLAMCIIILVSDNKP